MPDYSKAVIYTIKTGNSIYVGSTCNFRNRKYEHNKILYGKNYREYGRKLYKTIRDNDGEWDMKPHKEFPCENKTQLTIEEERIRVELNADLNSQSCHGLDVERRKKAKQQNHIEYYTKNKEVLTNKKNEWLKLNKEHDKARNLEYYYNNKESIREKQKEKTICECGCEVTKRNLKKHKTTDKHIKLIEAKTENL